MTIIFWLLKINSHFKFYYERNKEIYLGFITAYLRLSLFEKLRASLPIPVSGKDISLKIQREIFIYSILLGLCIGVLIIIGLHVSQ